MVDQKKIEEVRKRIKETINGEPMVIENEPDHSGDPKNTTHKDPDEKEDEKRNRK